MVSPEAATAQRRRSNASVRMSCSPIRNRKALSLGSSDTRMGDACYNPLLMSTDLVLTTPEEVEAILEYFNGFHDGFIKKLTLSSHDYFERRGVQACSGRLDLDLVIAHYNYRSGEPPANQLVH